MGGNKSKPAGKDKGTITGPGGEIKTASSTKEEKKKPQQKAKLAVTIDENQGMKAIQNMKAITIQSVAKAANVKISVANSLIRTLEAKGVVKKVGGYSGHRVYAKVK